MGLYVDKGIPSATVPETGRAPGARGEPPRRITEQEVLALQRQHRGALRTCYERALKRDDSLTDIKADVEVSIGDSGVVRAVNVTAGNNPELINCIRQRIKGWAFPAIGAQSFSFPIIFRGS